MLDTLFDPKSFTSFRRMSPEGLSTTKVGAVGEDGEEKA